MSVEKNSACGMTPCSISLIRTTAAKRAMLEPVEVPPLVSRPSPSRSVAAPPAADQPSPSFLAIQKLKTLPDRGSATARWPSDPGAISVSAGIGTLLRSGPYWLGLMEKRGVLSVICSGSTRGAAVATPGMPTNAVTVTAIAASARRDRRARCGRVASGLRTRVLFSEMDEVDHQGVRHGRYRGTRAARGCLRKSLQVNGKPW